MDQLYWARFYSIWIFPIIFVLWWMRTRFHAAYICLLHLMPINFCMHFIAWKKCDSSFPIVTVLIFIIYFLHKHSQMLTPQLRAKLLVYLFNLLNAICLMVASQLFVDLIEEIKNKKMLQRFHETGKSKNRQIISTL